ncbi:MAG TPA: ice-binding family protein [Acidimicrobiales bacterium]
MSVTRGSKTRIRLSAPAIAIGVVALVAPASLLFVSSADATAAAVPLGATSTFGVLAGAGITNTGPTTVNGDVGTYPTTSISGTGSMTINGTNQGGDAVTQQAKTDLVTAYNNAAGQGPTSPITSDLGGLTLAPGVYNSASSVGLTGALTLNGGGNASAVFIFQAGSTLTTASASQVVLTNGAQACNVFWQVGSSATLGTGSSFLGTIFAQQSITVTTGVTVGGRVLAENGAVTLDTDVITAPSCSTPSTATTTTASVAVTTTTPAVPTTSAPTAKAGVNKAAAKRAAAKRAAAKRAAAKKAAAKKAAAKKAAAKKAAVPTAPPSPIGTTVRVTG